MRANLLQLSTWGCILVLAASMPAACAEGTSAGPTPTSSSSLGGSAAAAGSGAGATAGGGGQGAAPGGSGGQGAVGAQGGSGATDAGADAEPDAGPPPPELVAWYRFEDPNSPQVLDSSQYGHHGWASAGVQRGVGGRWGLGVLFDGATSNIEVPYSALLDITGDVTLEAWIYLDAPVSYNRMLVRKLLQYQMSVSVVPQPNLLEFYSQPLGFARTSTPVQFAHWVHVATTHDGQTARLYFNGALADAVPLVGAKPSNASSLKIGGDGFNQSAPDGGMDEVKVWNVVRSEQEICEDGEGSYDANGSPKCSYN